MAKSSLLFFVIPALLLCGTANADFYTCKDGAGHVVSSDRPIPECAEKSTQVFKENGTLKNQLPAPLTPDQRRAIEIQEQQHQKDLQHQEELKREQLFLIAHYPNEGAIETARKKELDAIDVKIAAETRNIETATTTLNNNQRMLPNLQKNQPLKIRETQTKIDDMTQSIAESTRLIRSYQAEEISVNQQFDATHKRYLEVVTATKH